MVFEQRSTFLDGLLLTLILPPLRTYRLGRFLPIRSFWNREVSRAPSPQSAQVQFRPANQPARRPRFRLASARPA
ncbi:MAG: hypothetical protein HY329_06935 [Chloroflexi bacterium]|nr:hypothetical protein [Chloroflexota bacterium]